MDLLPPKNPNPNGSVKSGNPASIIQADNPNAAITAMSNDLKPFTWEDPTQKLWARPSFTTLIFFIGGLGPSPIGDPYLNI